MMEAVTGDDDDSIERIPIARIFLAFLKLGLTSFGGPVAHIGYFREDMVVRRGWLGERAYAALVALCQFLPGPSSSQIGIGVGLAKGGVGGAFAAWAGFTLPSAVAMGVFGWMVASGFAGGALDADSLHGLKVVAVAVVANALFGMIRSLCPNATLGIIAIIGGVVAFLLAGIGGQLAAIGLGGVCGYLISLRTPPGVHSNLPDTALPVRLPVRISILALVLFAGLLIALPAAAAALDCGWLGLADSFFRTGSLVFGGGHVVLPLLQAEVVPPVDKDVFLAGYGAAQAVPGPLFTFAGYLGTVMPGPNGGVAAGILCLVMIFLPSFLMIFAVLPFWSKLVSLGRVKAIITGINAGVVGLLGAAFVSPVFTSGVRNPADLAAAAAGFALLAFWKLPAWLAVLVFGAAYAAWSAMT